MHVLTATKPHNLKVRLESDLSLSHSELRKYFKGFMKHQMTSSHAFELLYIFSRKNRNKSYHPGKIFNRSGAGSNNYGGNSNAGITKSMTDGNSTDIKKDTRPIKFFPTHRESWRVASIGYKTSRTEPTVRRNRWRRQSISPNTTIYRHGQHGAIVLMKLVSFPKTTATVPPEYSRRSTKPVL